MKKWLLTALTMTTLLLPQMVVAQILRDEHGNILDENGQPITSTKNQFGRDTTNTKKHKEVPNDRYMWKIDERLGGIRPVEMDTAHHRFQNVILTGGRTGQYNHLGNLGSPRLSRLFMERPAMEQFIFVQPFDFWLVRPEDFYFANTKSPLTNLSYFSCGNRTNGEDKISAYFASNINKKSAVGFNLDYLYGRGYYQSQSNSMFNGSLFGYYHGEQYSMHALISANHMKMAENGGIEDDTYITNPESFNQSYGSGDIPTILTQNWNRNDNQTYLYSHRYNLGIRRYAEVPDSLKAKIPDDATLLQSFPDSVRTALQEDPGHLQLVLDSMKLAISREGVPIEFVPVTSFIHTVKMEHYERIYQAYSTPENYYTNHYYGRSNQIKDLTENWSVKNTVGIALREGFNKWAKAGLTAYASYEFRNFSLPYAVDTVQLMQKFKESNITVGGQLSKTMGRILHYNVDGNVVLAGEDIGQFSVVGDGRLNLPLFKDTAVISVNAYVKNLNPSFYYRRFQSQNAWWDNSLDKEFRTRIEGQVELRKTRTKLRVGVENVKNYTYFAKELTPWEDAEGGIGGYSQAVAVRQKSGSVQVLSAKLNQDFTFGPLNWENEVAYQTTSDKEVLPLPTVSLYSNLYLKFRIAKVLRVELGGDVRYFSAYYAPDYLPNMGQYATQASGQQIKIGNYPIVNAYINFHLKECRFFVMGDHLNAGTGNAFLAPHYPINPMAIRFGVSWNFYN